MNEDNEIIRFYKKGDELGILKLFYEVFGLNRTIDFWKWKFVDHVQGQGWVSVVEVGSEIVGHHSFMRNHLNFVGREVVAGQACDNMVRFDHRRRGLRTRIDNHLLTHCFRNEVKAIFCFPNRNSYPGWLRNHGAYRIASLRYYYYRIGFRRIWGYRIDQAFKFFFKIAICPTNVYWRLRQRKGVKITVSSHLPEGLEDMLKEIRDYEVLSIWKDLKYLSWRYENHPDYHYLFHCIHLEGKPQGIIVTRHHSDTVVICDVLHRTKDKHQSVLLLRHVLTHYVMSSGQKVEFYGHDMGFFEAIFSASGFKMLQYSDMTLVGTALRGTQFEGIFGWPHNWTIAYGDSDVV